MYGFLVKPVLDLVRAFVVADFTAQGERPDAVPLATTEEQAAYFATDGPVTVLQVRTARAEELATSCLIRLPVAVHHMRPLEAGTGFGAETALTRLSALAAALEGDYRLQSVGGADIPVHRVCPRAILVGEDNPVQQMLAMASLDVSLVAATLEVEVEWYEGE